MFGSEKRILPLTNLKRNGPGPGSYNHKSRTSKIRTDPAFSMGGASRKLGKSGPVKAIHSIPGPGEYQVEKKIAIGNDADKRG